MADMFVNDEEQKFSKILDELVQESAKESPFASLLNSTTLDAKLKFNTFPSPLKIGNAGQTISAGQLVSAALQPGGAVVVNNVVVSNQAVQASGINIQGTPVVSQGSGGSSNRVIDEIIEKARSCMGNKQPKMPGLTELPKGETVSLSELKEITLPSPVVEHEALFLSAKEIADSVSYVEGMKFVVGSDRKFLVYDIAPTVFVASVGEERKVLCAVHMVLNFAVNLGQKVSKEDILRRLNEDDDSKQ